METPELNRAAETWSVGAMEELADLRGKMERERILADRLAESARNVIEQWDTPNWKLTQSTAHFIHALRNSVAYLENYRSNQPKL